MTMNDEQPRFGAALHEAAQSFDPPNLDTLYEGAMRRARRTTQRRRAIGAGISVLALVGVVIGVNGGIPGAGHASKATPVVTATSGSVAEHMATSLMALLPEGVTLVTNEGVVPLTGEGYEMRSSMGDWGASASAFVTYQGKRVTFDLSVIQQRVDGPCIDIHSSGYTCTTSTLDGHTLLSAYMHQKGDPVSWSYTWNLDGAKAVQLNTNQNLSASEVEKLLTSPAWTSVLRGLPAAVNCPSLGQIKEKTGWYWRCASTGKTYPTTSTDIYLYPTPTPASTK